MLFILTGVNGGLDSCADCGPGLGAGAGLLRGGSRIDMPGMLPVLLGLGDPSDVGLAATVTGIATIGEASVTAGEQYAAELTTVVMVVAAFAINELGSLTRASSG